MHGGGPFRLQVNLKAGVFRKFHQPLQVAVAEGVKVPNHQRAVGIAAGHFWLLPHPELTFSLLDARYDAMRRRELAPEEDWTQQQ